MVVAGFVIIGERTGEGTLGALFAQHVVLLWCQLRTPLGVSVRNLGWIVLLVGRCAHFVTSGGLLDAGSRKMILCLINFGDYIDLDQGILGKTSGFDRR